MGKEPLPSPEQARQGAMVAGDNAHDLLAAARSIAMNGFNGLAISMLVLSLEEAEKCRALVAVATNDDSFRLTEGELRGIIYRDHGLRLRAASAETISPATIIGVLTTRPRDRTPLQQKQLDNDVAMLNWHSEANSLKHRGLYVNFVDNHWESPRDVGKDEFSRALPFVDLFVQVTLEQTARLAP